MNHDIFNNMALTFSKDIIHSELHMYKTGLNTNKPCKLETTLLLHKYRTAVNNTFTL